ncbi:Glycine cleavage system H protein [Candidatus Izimaplasma bacterium HR1]|jgi:glycine cleavage system H protein|uniref:glycine cleavage system protein GcvH n=1 Tax=Candidatus Izimoplasma sp. HR1 TaxID=1541959 RepID=UPI0004F5A1D2|nr:Glycine cleavage system H protein [Candidatus Izimaplasma bacterium HR1]
MSKVVEGLYYTNTHEWVRVEDGFAYIGITDYAQESLGEIVFVELPEEENAIEAGEELGTIESVKAASDISSPITGTIVVVNDELEDSPELLNEDSYENWIVKVDMENESELNKLLNAIEYKEICE